MIGKIKVINGIFKGLESCDEFFDINMQSDKNSTLTFRVDQRNKITVDFADVEFSKNEYIIYVENDKEVTEIVGIFNLSDIELHNKLIEMYNLRFGNNEPITITGGKNNNHKFYFPNNFNSKITAQLTSRLNLRLDGKSINLASIKKLIK